MNTSPAVLLAASMLATVAQAAEKLGRQDIADECRRDLSRLPVPQADPRREAIVNERNRRS